MRVSIFFGLLSVVHPSVLDSSSDCERMYIKERCNRFSCAGYAGHEPNNRILLWESCNVTVKNQMEKIFPSWNLGFAGQMKCTPQSYGSKYPPPCKPYGKKYKY